MQIKSTYNSINDNGGSSMGTGDVLSYVIFYPLYMPLLCCMQGVNGGVDVVDALVIA